MECLRFDQTMRKYFSEAGQVFRRASDHQLTDQQRVDLQRYYHLRLRTMKDIINHKIYLPHNALANQTSETGAAFAPAKRRDGFAGSG